jgi:hypothetical protein
MTPYLNFARQVVKNSPKELAMMRRSPAEACYGVQIATNAIGEGVRAGLQAAEAGAATRLSSLASGTRP